MKKYMVIAYGEGKTSVSFYDTFSEAENAHMDYECGLGWYAEVYERGIFEKDCLEEYRLIFV